MSVTYKFVLDKRRIKEDCIYPLKLRVYCHSGNKEKTLKIEINEFHWDNDNQIILKSDPNYRANNFKLSNVIAKLERRLLLATDEPMELTALDLLQVLEQKVSRGNNVSFSEFAKSLIEDMFKAGKAGNALAYTDGVNSLKAFLRKDEVRFEDITYSTLANFSTAKLGAGVKVNTIAAYLRSIRAIYNKAIKADIVTLDKYPFSKYKIETEATPSRKLTIEEMKLILAVNLKVGSAAWHYRNYFMLSFCLIGINFADLFTLRRSNISEDTITYQRHKTGRIYSFNLPGLAKDILDYYDKSQSKNTNGHLLPVLEPGLDPLKERKQIKGLCKSCSKYMKLIAKECNINKPISTYYARYTWANIAKQLGYSNDLIAEALGHEYGNNVTNIYLDKFSSDVVSKMNENVLNSVYGGQTRAF